MHGLINRSIQTYVTHSYGHETWLAVVQKAALPFVDFEGMLSYSETYTPSVLDAVAHVLDRTRGDVMEDIGAFIVSYPGFEGVRRLLRFSGDDFVDFLLSLDDLDDRVRLAVSDLHLPKVEVTEISEGNFELRCEATIEGYGHVMMGVMRAMADDYGALALLEHTSGPADVELVSITLVETDFAEGRTFELGARVG